mgnify:CR=1 FL=1
MYLILLFSFLINATTTPKTTDNLVVEIKNINFDKGGTICIELCDAQNKTVKLLKQTVKTNENVFLFTDLPFGKYAIRAFHDANNNGKLDIGLFGQPIEGWGVSNDARGFMSAPPLTKMLFDHTALTKISFKLSY